MLCVLLMGLALLSLFVYVTRPQRLARMTSDLLTDMTGADVQIESARFWLDGTVQLGQLQMSVPDLPPDAAQLFEARQVVVKHSLWSLASGRFTPHSLIFMQPTLYRTEMIEDGKFNFEYLKTPDRDDELKIPEHLPQISIRGGMVVFAEHDRDQHDNLGNMALDGTLVETLEDNNAYFFNLRQKLADGKSGPTLSGKFNLRTLAVAGELQSFFIEGPQRNILPRRMRAWWDLLDPEGSFPQVRFGYDPQIGAHAVLDVQNVALTLPYLEAESRMTVKAGRFTLANETITFDKLVGQVEEFQYEINGRVNGFSADAPFALTARILGTVPDQPHYLPALPIGVQKSFNRFTPTGKLAAMVILERKRAGSELVYDGQIEVTQAKLRDARFPYPLDNVSGEFRFDNHQVKIVAMRGDGPTGAKAVIRGLIAPPGHEAAVDMTVNWMDLPIDDVLMAALKPNQRSFIDKLIDKDIYARLTDVDTGMIKSSQQHEQWSKSLTTLKTLRRRLESAKQIDEPALLECKQQIVAMNQRLGRPLFDMGGVVSGVTQIRRPKGPDQRFSTVTTANVQDVGALLTKWPYPLKVTGGKINISKTQVLLEDVTIAGVTGGNGKVTGKYFRDSDATQRWTPKIHFVTADHPVDNVLLSAIPAEGVKWIDTFRIKGKIDVAGELFRRKDGQIDFLARTELREGSATPYGGDYRIADLASKLVISRQRVQIDSAIGRHGTAEISLKGEIITQGPNKGMALRVTGTDLNFADPVLDLMQPDTQARNRIRQIFAAHKPSGAFDAEYALRNAAAQPSDFTLTLKPRQLAIEVQNQRANLSDVTGSLVFTPQGLNIQDLAANYGTGHLNLSGTVSPDENPTVKLNFDAQNDQVCPVTRAFMPKGVLSTLDNLKLAAGYAVKKARLNIKPRPDSDHHDFSFSCQADLSNASAVIGLPVTELGGRLQITAQGALEDQLPKLDLTFDAHRGRIKDRLVTNLKLTARTDTDRNVLRVDSLTGDCYNGKIVGRGEVDINGDGKYQVEISAQNVALHPFINPGEETPAQDQAALSAQLSLHGRIDNDEARFGRGSFQIADAKMYRVPLAMAVMHVLNLSLPASSSFDQAAAQFLVDGDAVMFESIHFDSPTLQMSGEGVMDWASQQLDLDLDLRNPDGLKLGKVSDFINVFKDELLHIHVGGTVDEPKASLKSLKGIRKGWRDLFSGVREKLGQLNPLASAPKRDEADGTPSTSGQ